MNVTERILCNTCDQWAPPPYRKGRCPRCTGATVGNLRVYCGDCDQYPCTCQRPPGDADMCVQFQTHTGPPPGPPPSADMRNVKAPEPEPAPTPVPKQRAEGTRHTCEVCGRIGTRRYVETPTGWKCSPTAACAPQFRPPGTLVSPPRQKPTQTSDIPAKDFPPNVTPQPARPPRAPSLLLQHAVDTTAACQDCPRRWNLTGRVLQSAIDMHEQKHGHIVDTFAEVL